MQIYISTGYGVSGHNMFAYCINNPVNYFDSTGRLPSAKLSLSDYYVIHKRVQIEVVYHYGYAMEVYVKGENGKGFLDLYDAKNHEFYEVTTQRQAGSDKKNDQMEKYEASIVHDWRFPEAEDMSSPTRGTSKKISGEFSYKNWDVEYKSNGEGYITYTTDFNEDRSRDKAAVIVTAFSIAGIGYMIPGGKVSWDVTCYMLM